MSWYFFGGFSRVADRAVGPVREPLGVLGHPGVVGAALERDVERDLDPELGTAATNARRSASVPRSGCTAVCPPSAAPIAHGLPTSSGPATSVLSRPLRCATPTGWIGGRYTTSKPAAAAAIEAVPRARALHQAALGPGEELVPGAPDGELAVDAERLPRPSWSGRRGRAPPRSRRRRRRRVRRSAGPARCSWCSGAGRSCPRSAPGPRAPPGRRVARAAGRRPRTRPSGPRRPRHADGGHDATVASRSAHAWISNS